MSVLKIAILVATTTLPALAELYCWPEPAVVFTGESVRLRAWPSPRPYRNYHWGV